MLQSEKKLVKSQVAWPNNLVRPFDIKFAHKILTTRKITKWKDIYSFYMGHT